MKQPNRHYLFLRRLLRIIFKILFRVDITGLENVKLDENVVLVANHNSWLDPLLIMAFLPKMKFGLLAEGTSALSADWIQKIIKRADLNLALVDRGDNKSRLKGFYSAHKIIKGGDSFLIFPEGRINLKEGKMYPFFMGAFSLATKHERKILPIFIRGNEELYLGRRICFSVGEMIKTKKDDNVEDLARNVYHNMLQNVRPEKPYNRPVKHKMIELTKMFLGEMAEEYDTDDVIIRGNEAAKIFNRVNHKNKDKYTHNHEDEKSKNQKLVKSYETN